MPRGLALALVAVATLLLAAAAAVGARAAAYKLRYDDVRFPRVPRERFAPAPGDVLLFIPHTHGFHNSVVTHNLFSHAALVVPRDAAAPGGALALAETSNYPIRLAKGAPPLAPPGGSALYPLAARVATYPGSVFWMPLVLPLGPARAARLAALAARRVPYPPPLALLARTLGLGRVGRGRTCEEYVAALLDGVGLTPTGEPPLGATGLRRAGRRLAALPGRPLGEPAANLYAPIRQVLGPP
jgi:hypothetical protein